MRTILTLLVVGAALFAGWQQLSPLIWPPPLPLENPAYTIRKVEPYELQALVMSVKHYPRGEGAAVMPTDLALAWGEMADPEKLERLSISQRNRFYFWKADQETLETLTRPLIETETANVHVVPGDETVRTTLREVRRGDSLYLEGWLVDIEGKERSWRSSRSRTDTGPGACEIFLVKTLVRSPAL